MEEELDEFSFVLPGGLMPSTCQSKGLTAVPASGMLALESRALSG